MIPRSHTIWAIWIYLPALARMFVVVLCIVGLYSLISAGFVLVRLRSLAKVAGDNGGSGTRIEFAALERRAANLRQLLGFAACLFGFVYFTGMQLAYLQIINSGTPPDTLILEDFYVHFVVGANVFVVFLFLHCVQWFVSGRVRAYATRFNS